jgi:hypothetical protein
MTAGIKDLLEQEEPALSADAQTFLADLPAATDLHAEFPPGDVLEQDPKCFVFRFRLRSESKTVRLPWSSRLEHELYARSIRMDRLEDESARGGTLLLWNLRYIDLSFGRDYTDSVLWELIEDQFGKIDAIRKTLARIHHHRPHESPSLAECFALLDHEIAGYGNSLVLELKYDRQRAYNIQVAAVWYVLDRRHHLSAREILFPEK